MTMTHHGHDTHSDPSLAGFSSHQQGWRLFLTLRNAEHYSYTDLEQFLGQLLSARIAPRQITPARVSEVIGAIPPTRAVAAERAYIAAFFDLQLRGTASANTLLSRPSPHYPEIQSLGRLQRLPAPGRCACRTRRPGAAALQSKECASLGSALRCRLSREEGHVPSYARQAQPSRLSPASRRHGSRGGRGIRAEQGTRRPA